jgi:hypothetical protein
MRTAFEDPDSEKNEPETKSGLKINNSKSKFQVKNDQKKDFDQKVKELVSEKSERNKKALELGQKFLSALNDKTLSSNKSLIQKDLEKQICNDLFLLATAVNNDPTESEGGGSLVLDTLFFKSLLMMRDRLNELEYSFKSLNEKLKE